jgi:catechol 2,3-dioxygenase-like lactoylglutathione lyase family enzyme
MADGLQPRVALSASEERRMRLDQAMLFVKDLERMTRFYTDIIGFRPIEATRLVDWVEFETGGGGFSLHAIPPDIAERIAVASPPVPRDQQSCKLLLSTDDVDAELARLTVLGVTILHRPWGGGDAVDPEGNVLGVRSRETGG